MNLKIILKTLPLLGLLHTSFAQTAAESLEQGVLLQTVQQDLDAAIKEYKNVLKTSAKSMRLAAEARYRLAECFLAKGNEKRAQEHLAKLKADFPAENQWVAKAVKLAPLKTEFAGMPWKDGRIYHLTVKMPGGKEVGEFVLAERRIHDAPEETWESIAIRGAGGRSLSQTRFTSKGYRSLGGRWYMQGVGDAKIEFEGMERATIFDSETGKQRSSFEFSEVMDPSIPVFENEALIQVVRTLNQEVGTKQKTIALSSLHDAMPIPYDLEVIEHVDVTTPAGVFPCAKIKASYNQTYYISRDEKRDFVKMDIGQITLNLERIEDWDLEGMIQYRAENFTFSYAVPGTMIQGQEEQKEDRYRAKFWASDFAGRDCLLECKPKKELPEAARKSARAYAEHLHAEVKKTNIFPEFEVEPDSWEEFKVGDKNAVRCQIKGKLEEQTDCAYHVTVLDPSLDFVISAYIYTGKVDLERATKRLDMILETFQFE